MQDFTNPSAKTLQKETRCLFSSRWHLPSPCCLLVKQDIATSQGYCDIGTSPGLGLWLVEVRAFLALRVACGFKWWRVQGPLGPDHMCVSGLEILLFHRTSCPTAPESPLTKAAWRHMNRATFWELAQLLRAFGALCEDISSEEFLRLHRLRPSASVSLVSLGSCVFSQVGHSSL